MLDECEVANPRGVYQCIVHPPMATTLRAFRKMLSSEALPVIPLKSVLQHVLLAVDFLHTEAGVVHTDIQEDNILLGLDETSAEHDLEQFERHELDSPRPRKIDGDRTIHTSRPLAPPVYPYGPPVLCDLGQGRFGQYDHMVDIQPYPYRAPEVILDIP